MKGMSPSFGSLAHVNAPERALFENEGNGSFIIVLVTTSEVVNNDEQLFRGRVFNNGAFVEECPKLRHGFMCAQRWVDVCQ